jgi:putative PIN family toxin of toxin-antitoxin system
VLDINALASAVGPTIGPPALALHAGLRGEYDLVLSEAMIDVFARVLRKPYFARFVAPDRVAALCADLSALAELVLPDSTIRGIAADAEDDLVLATAIAGSADYLVTGDAGFLLLDPFRDIRIVTPSHFLDVLEGREPG